MKIYEDAIAYETIQRDVEQNFYKYIGENKSKLLDVVIVGAYQGHEIQSFLDTYENINIYAYEPVPETFKVLEENYKDYSNVKCFNCAISDKKGTVIFNDVSTPGCGSLKKFIDDGHNKIANSFEVRCATIEDCFGYTPIDLLWVDTQGTELDVLKGVPNLHLVESLFLEVTMDDGHIAYEGNTLFSELEKFLKPTHFCHSIGLDNESGNGTGNSFWLHNRFRER